MDQITSVEDIISDFRMKIIQIIIGEPTKELLISMLKKSGPMHHTSIII